jgi:hopanoid biosynthesis associated protein HpnK
MVRFGIDIILSPGLRKQLAAEIEAQFEAFRATGLALDHLNAHKHFYLHPVVSSLTLSIGRRYGLRALRVPREPHGYARHAADAARGLPRLWVALLRRRAGRAALQSAEQTYGNAFSGAMTKEQLLRIVDVLAPGVSEIYLHPATSDRFAAAVPGYRYGEELAALLSPDVAARLRDAGIVPCRFADLPA